MPDFAFRPPGAMHAPAKLTKHSTGLWSGEVSHISGGLTTRGHLSKRDARLSADEQSLSKFGRKPVYIHEDKE